VKSNLPYVKRVIDEVGGVGEQKTGRKNENRNNLKNYLRWNHKIVKFPYPSVCTENKKCLQTQ